MPCVGQRSLLVQTPYWSNRHRKRKKNDNISHRRPAAARARVHTHTDLHACMARRFRRACYHMCAISTMTCTHHPCRHHAHASARTTRGTLHDCTVVVARTTRGTLQDCAVVVARTTRGTLQDCAGIHSTPAASADNDVNAASMYTSFGAALRCAALVVVWCSVV